MKKMSIWKAIEQRMFAQNKGWWENGFSHWLFIFLRLTHLLSPTPAPIYMIFKIKKEV